MAEIQSQQLQQKGAGVKRSKKLSTRIDLTPMVDLGFLLITFFIFTTTMSKPATMPLGLPADGEGSKVNEKLVLTLILENDAKVGYYYGDDVKNMQFTGYGTGGLRNVILQKRAAVTKEYGKPDDLTVLIKPTDQASYKNVIEVFDEMLITNVKIYMLLDADKMETSVAIR